MRLPQAVTAVLACCCLSGCVGAGVHAARLAFAEKPSERIEHAQELAITQMDGGKPGIPIAWQERHSGAHGTLMPDAAAAGACRHYRQTMTIGNETTEGTLTACRASDGSWRLAPVKAG